MEFEQRCGCLRDQGWQATGVEVGTAQLTATAGSQSARVNIIVVAPPPSGNSARRRKTEPAGDLALAEVRGRETGRGPAQPQGASGAPDIRKDKKYTHLAHRARATNAALQIGYVDDDSSRFVREVGAPPGHTEPGAPTPPAAIPGTEKPGTSSFSFGVPVASLPGRGIDVALSLVYNSQLWNKKGSGTGTSLTYDRDAGWPGPGFSLGYGKLSFGNISGPFTGTYTIIDPDGTRHVTYPQGDFVSDAYLSSDFDLRPGDRIAWVGKNRNSVAKEDEAAVLCIMECQVFAKTFGYSVSPRTNKDGFPILFSFLTNSPPPKYLEEVYRKISEMGIPRTWM